MITAAGPSRQELDKYGGVREKEGASLTGKKRRKAGLALCQKTLAEKEKRAPRRPLRRIA
jgi:hypothetical protein